LRLFVRAAGVSAPDGTICETRESAAIGDGLKLNCGWGFGSATFVTGAFGFAAASLAVKRVIER